MIQLLSDNKRILILGDVHQSIHKVKYILAHESYDEVVFTGDFFDSFIYNTDSDVTETCHCLLDHLEDKKFYSVMGNHDLGYLYNNQHLSCSGYSIDKQSLIDGLFKKDKLAIRNKFQWYIWIDDFLCTHAGLHPSHISPSLDLDPEGFSHWMDNECKAADVALSSNQLHWFYQCGMARGGKFNKGGIVWLDFAQEFKPIDGLKQIVGHTGRRHIVHHNKDGNMQVPESSNIDVDCGLYEYLIIQNKKIEVKKYSDL